MSDQTKPTAFALNGTKPNLSDALNLLKTEIFLSFNCHALATISSFDPARQVATATMNYTKTFIRLNSATGQYGPVQVTYPPIVDCPVIFLGGSNGYLTFPISVGDECLVLFNDRDIDNWFIGQPVGEVNTSRMHSFTDGIILVGIRSQPKALPSVDAGRAVLGDLRGAKVGVGASGGTQVLIRNNDTTLNTLLQTLITDINALVTAVAAITVVTSGTPSGTPVNAAAITAVTTSLNALATQIGGLLE